MSLAPDARGRQDKPWFATWFDTPHYHLLYANRDQQEAAAFVTALVDRLAPEPDAAVLDLGCGAGRHAHQLARRGFRVTGMDLSASSIRIARRQVVDGLRFVRRDMRRPLGCGRYDYVFNLFTSFGYFDDAGHDQVVQNIATALRPGGVLLMDYLNVAAAERALVPLEWKAIDGVHFRLHRWSDATHFFKRIEVVGNDGHLVGDHVERVAKLRRGDFEALFARHGLRLESVFGDYGFGDYDPATSPRLVMVARKEETPRIRVAASA